MRKSFFAAGALAALACGAAPAAEPSADAWPIRAVQLDLARQMETVPMLKGYFDILAKAGYNTVVLYLEGRVQTKTFALPAGEGYSPAELRELVEHAGRLGLDVVPVVTVLGHGEKFFRYRDAARDALAEEREGDARFKVPGGPAPDRRTFCWSLPGTAAFYEKYLSEVAEIFPGKNFHVGMDESWNTGFCPLCREKVSGGRLGEHFTEIARWTHGVLARLGKRMWIWDDFYEFFPEKLEELPRDVVLCNWQYAAHITPHGGRGHYANQIRRDWLRTYSRLGFKTVIATHAGHPENSRSFNDYARKRKDVIGVLDCHWELEREFTGYYLPSIVGSAKIFCDPNGAVGRDCMGEAIAELFPSLDAAGREAVRTILSAPPSAAAPLDNALSNPQPDFSYGGVKLAVETLRRQLPEIGRGEIAADQLSESARLDDLLLTADLALVNWRLNRLTPYLVRPDRTASDVAQAKSRAAQARAEVERIVARRERQVAAWRKGCEPSLNAAPARQTLKVLDEVAAVSAGAAADDEWIVELVLALPDFYGTPWWTVSARFDGEWKTVAANWLSKPFARDWAHYGDFRRFRAKGRPDAVRISYRGYGEAGLDYVALESKAGRWVPNGVSRCEGAVRNCEKALKDNWDAAWFGFADRGMQVLDPRLAEAPAVVEFSLVREAK